MNQSNRGLFALLGVIVFVLLLGPVLMGGMTGAGVAGPGMMGWGYAQQGGVSTGNGWAWGLGMGLSGLMMLAFWGALIVLLVRLVRRPSGQLTTTVGPATSEEPLAILRRRYAAGEIDDPTYQRMKSELGGPEGNIRQAVGVNGRSEVPH
jgi:putative membrane protein